jgi:hypothetical protein
MLSVYLLKYLSVFYAKIYCGNFSKLRVFQQEAKSKHGPKLFYKSDA